MEANAAGRLGEARSVRALYTHCLTDARESRLIDATYKNPTGEGDVEAEVDQHVPKLPAHSDRPAVAETTDCRAMNEKRGLMGTPFNTTGLFSYL